MSGEPSVSAALEGLLPICKPPGMTSHDVVAALRRLTGVRHTGHAGTLDPAAAGILLILAGVGPSRLAEFLLAFRKTYLAEIRFGLETDTQDYTGKTVSTAPRQAVAGLSLDGVREAAARFVGPIEQVPPMVSAVRVGGERLHRLAREGRTVAREPRPVTIYDLKVLDLVGTVARIRVSCSAGTYVRTLAADIGRALGVGAHMGFLVREAVGPFGLEAALTLEETAEASRAGTLGGLLVPPAEIVGHLPAARLGDAEAAEIRWGHAVACPPLEDGLDAGTGHEAEAGPGPAVRVLSPAGELLAIGFVDGRTLRPRKVLKPLMGGGRDGARRRRRPRPGHGR